MSSSTGDQGRDDPLLVAVADCVADRTGKTRAEVLRRMMRYPSARAWGADRIWVELIGPMVDQVEDFVLEDRGGA